MSEKRIVIFEGERDLTGRVATRLRKDGYVVQVVANGPAGFQQIRSNPPDLIVIDVLVPNLDSLKVVTDLRRDFLTSVVPIIVLGARSEESDVVTGLALGADDYIAKPLSLPVLAARVGAILRRSSKEPLAEEPLVIGPLSLDTDRHIVRVNGRIVDLTVTEFRLLVALTSAHGRVLSRAQLIDQALRDNVVATDRIVDVHITSLRRKLGEARVMVRTVRGVGYSIEEAVPASEDIE